MIEILKKQFTENMSPEEKLNKLREFLQIMALKILYDKGFLNKLAFVGGTALRVLYDIRRFSEDLDFSLIQKKDYDFLELNAKLMRGFKLYGLSVEGKPKNKEKSIVHSTFLKFSGLLRSVGLSALESQKLFIKFEIDTNPPKGGNITTTLVNKTYIINITHFDLPSAFATKLHACFYRKFTKGRDFYDFIWYMSRKTKPNYTLLNNAIEQTEGSNAYLNEDNFKEFLLKNIEKIDFDQAKKDVERFLEDKSELKLFDKKLIINSIESIYSS